MKFTSKTAQKKDFIKVKFPFQEGDNSSGVELRFVTFEEQAGAYKELVTEEIDFAIHPKTKKLTKVVTPKFNTSDLEAWLIDHRISSFWGIFVDEKEIECTKENKVMLYWTFPEFREFVDQKYTLVEDAAKETYGSTSAEKN